jgi:GPH family glycoside/pentoside/hexuronide:cation symporter
MIADVADEDELASGQRREGVLFGIASLGEQIASSVAVLVAGVGVDRFAGLVPGQALQDPLTIERIGLLYSVLPAGFLVLAAAVLLRYPLDRDQVRAIQEKLARPGTTA